MSRQGITPADAARTIVADASPLAVEPSGLDDIVDRVLAEPIQSPLDIPAWDNSAMDGFAVRSSDVVAAGATLRVIESVPAGRFPTRRLGLGESTRIFTGAPIPEGADGVIRAGGRHSARW